MNKKIIELGDGIFVEAANTQDQGFEQVSKSLDKTVDKFEISFSHVKNVITKICDTVTDTYLEINEKMKAETASLEFGLSFSNGGKIFIVEANAQANLKITINWNFDKMKS